MNQNQLNAIKARMIGTKLENRPHRVGKISVDAWVYADRPFLWVKVETREDYEAFIDFGWSTMALFKKDVLLGWGFENIILPDVAMLDKDYYNVDKYIWM